MRSGANAHHAAFNHAFVGWRWPARGQPKKSGLDVAAVLERWLAQYPENAETIQQFALGAMLTAAALEEWTSGRRIAGVGLNASLLGTLAEEKRGASATLLGFLAARSELGIGDVLAARTFIERAMDSLQQIDAYTPLASYLQLQRHLLTAELAESSLELASAAQSYDRAMELVGGIAANRRRAGELEASWIALAFGKVPEGQVETAHSLWEFEIGAARRRTILGLARTSTRQEPSRDAVGLCLDEGLPLAQTALALLGVMSKLPRAEIDDVADRLVAAARELGDHRDTWHTALRALQAEAWLALGDVTAAWRAVNSLVPGDLARADAIALGLAFAVRARLVLRAGSFDEARDQVETLLLVHAAAIGQLAGTSLQLRMRAASEPALNEAARGAIAELAKKPSAATRRQASMLIDALRAAENIPSIPDSSLASAVQDATRHAADRIGRLAVAVASHGDAAGILVLIIQSVGDQTTFICVGGDTALPIAVCPPDAASHKALRALSDAAERAIREGTRDFEMEAAGRTTFDTLPSMVRERLLRARTLVVVPDFASGQDRIPIELLHDGARFVGLSKVVARCLSVTHALRALEAPLVSPLAGRRALCVSVATPPGLAALRFADLEITAVSGVLQGTMRVTPVRDSEADVRTILELAPLANVLHIACHGEASAGAEALILADGVRLSAADIATKHRLRGVVYLNACSLAQGRYLGGGVSRGVAYAFVRAGAPCVIANLLPVEDQGAALLGETFYRAAREHGVGEAMRRAREQLQGQVNIALLTASVVIGNPFARLDDASTCHDDATSRLFRDVLVPEAMPAARDLGERGADPRFAAAIAFARGVRGADDAELETLARVAADIGHDIGEAHCWLTLADRQRKSADAVTLTATLRRAVEALVPLRGVWRPAFEAHRSARAELRALDPAYEPRTLKTVRTESGLSINDRSDPAVDAILRMSEALQEHEAYWRGDPVLRVPDRDVASLAHNAVVWGYLNRVYDSGAEAGVAAAFAERAAWRGLVAGGAVPDLARILAGLLCFLWGQQKVQHLEHWMAGAHRDVIVLAIERVRKHWIFPSQSPAVPAAREVATALDKLFVAQGGGSKFAQARAALRTTEPITPRLDQVRAQIETSVRQLHDVDPYAAADFGAWVLGELLTRSSTAAPGPNAQQIASGCKSLYDTLELKQEGWFMPYLMDGFRAVRATGGQDLFAMWSADLL